MCASWKLGINTVPFSCFIECESLICLTTLCYGLHRVYFKNLNISLQPHFVLQQTCNLLHLDWFTPCATNQTKSWQGVDLWGVEIASLLNLYLQQFRDISVDAQLHTCCLGISFFTTTVHVCIDNLFFFFMSFLPYGIVLMSTKICCTTN